MKETRFDVDALTFHLMWLGRARRPGRTRAQWLADHATARRVTVFLVDRYTREIEAGREIAGTRRAQA